MSGDIVNLRRARKHRDRRDRDSAAAANRVAHGIPKTKRVLADAQRSLEAQRLDDHRLDASIEGATPV